jgi:2-polyprenyl-3-methyl-5-hydroxy-6-metoxy-1,4-benzoquinol methylase
MSVEDFHNQVASKERFEFGKNWKEFLAKLNNDRIKIAESSLMGMLKIDDFEGKNFLDIGSGSGLSSLAAINNGANVTSFDFDDKAVWCTNELKNRYYQNSHQWKIIQGSVLEDDFVSSLGLFDIVYSWGVLHHTGEMHKAIDNAVKLVDKDGIIFLAIYNDQGFKSHIWWIIKYTYNQLPGFLRKPFAYFLGFTTMFFTLIKYTIKLQPMKFIKPNINYKESRGMSILSDMIDWYGGFPYEFLTYEHLVSYVEGKGFKLVNSEQASSLGCHQVVFKNVSR